MIVIRLLRRPSGYTCSWFGNVRWLLQWLSSTDPVACDPRSGQSRPDAWQRKQNEKPIGTRHFPIIHMIVIYHVSMFRNVPSILNRQIKSIPPSIPRGISPCLQHSLVFGIAHPWQSFLMRHFELKIRECRNWRWWIHMNTILRTSIWSYAFAMSSIFIIAFFGKNSLPKNATRFLVFHHSCDHGCRPPQVAQQENLVVMVCHCNF